MNTSQTKKTNTHISKTLRTTPVPTRAGLSFDTIKSAILGPSYSLSVVFIGDTLSKRLNSEYRSKDKPTDVLSFPLSETEGELFINLPYVRRSHTKYNHSYVDHVYFLFIHGLLHLKGLSHGSRMEHEEDEYCSKFNITISR